MVFTPFRFCHFSWLQDSQSITWFAWCRRYVESNKPQGPWDGSITCQCEDVIPLACPQVVASRSVVKQTWSHIQSSTKCLSSLNSVYVRYVLDVAPVSEI